MSRRTLLIFVAAIATSACERDVTVDFSARGVSTSASSAGLARNEPFVVSFSAKIDEHGFPSDGVRVTTRDGRRVPTRTFARHDALYVEAESAEGWPADAELLVEIPFPPLGPPVRSKEGRHLSKGFAATLKTSVDYAPRTGALRVVARDLVHGLRDVTQDGSFRFSCDGPVDSATVDSGFVVVDVDRRDDRRVATARLIGPDEILVAPFAGGGFRGGATYALETTAELRALDGRAARAGTTWRFSTAKGLSGEHRTVFRAADLESPELNPDDGALRPTRRVVVAAAAPGVNQSTPYGFGAGGFRIQTRIPSETLGDDDVLVERLAIPVAHGGRAAAVVRGIEIRLGDAIDAPGRELREAFDDNWRATATPIVVDDLDVEGSFVARVDWDGKVEVRFAAPYLHRALDGAGFPRDLLIEIVVGDAVSTDTPIFPLLGRRFGDSVVRCVASSDAFAANGVRCDVVPAIEAIGWRFPPVHLKPWTTDIPSPRYFDRPDAVLATGRPFEDFTVEYRALDLSPFGGAPTPATPWSPRLSTIQGRTSIQARVVFHPRPASAGRVSPSVERLSLPFVAGP